MMKVSLSNAAIENILRTIAPVVEADNYIRFNIGTGSVKNQDGSELMVSKVFVTNEREQVETMFTSTVPAEVEKPLSECTVDSPLETCVVKAQDFKAVAEVLVGFERAISLDTDKSKMNLFIEGMAEMPVYKADPAVMKVLLPNRTNTADLSKIDKDLAVIRVWGEDFLAGCKTGRAFDKRISSSQIPYYTVSVADRPVVTEVIKNEEGEVERTYMRSNASMQLVCTDGQCMTSGVARAVIKKGTGTDIWQRLAMAGATGDETVTGILTAIKNKENPDLAAAGYPVLTIERDGETFKAAASSYVEARKKAEESWGVVRKTEVNASSVVFFLSCAALDSIVKLISVQPDQYVEIAVGERYIYVNLSSMHAVYMTALYKGNMGKTVDCTELVGGFCKMLASANSVTVDNKAVLNAIKLASLYDKDAVIKHMPMELVVLKDGISLKRGESQTTLKAIEKNGEVEGELSLGVSMDYLGGAAGGFPAGSFKIYYNATKCLFGFAKGGTSIGVGDEPFMVAAGADLAKSREKAEAEAQKELEAKKAKENKEAKAD